MCSYSQKDIKLAIDKLNLRKKDIVYVSGNIINFGIPNFNKQLVHSFEYNNIY